ncbi:Sir2 silent information regulator family NAD-dependent deacetylase [Ruminococcus sp.]|uniref:SIR2 family NAD-dependent protein deacylase n=1 Tax=Ruminococcus sp. TaxID=41978 RepID=UPI002BD9F0F1|nr:Sir2 silent information regulator family NAD-dependent deacetylase [Ruminococcus sp.]HOH88320.1 Sir2 silent information regulator family NAD-dependent deacetylase [Ruminococcus sp.]
MTEIEKLKAEIKSADAIVIGAGAGLSTAAGFTYSGERFERFFPDFEAKYGFHDMYSGGFYPFATPEEMWAYWSRFIWCNRYMDIDNVTYKTLFELVKDKDYFVITTNVDHQFQKAGFDKKRLFYTQGDYGLLQCSEPCHTETYDNEEIVKDMIEFQEDMRIPTELIPKCPKCGKPMTMNLRSDDKFVEDEGWHKAAERYDNFIRTRSGQHILFLELGVGYNTPVIIKYPFWKMTAQNPKAVYACLNFGEAYAPDEIREQSICINGDIREVLSKIQ